MSPQLTLQAPLDLPPAEVTPYLERLWSDELERSTGASTFTLVVYEPSWLQQHLMRTGRIDGPITGLLRPGTARGGRKAAGRTRPALEHRADGSPPGLGARPEAGRPEPKTCAVSSSRGRSVPTCPGA